jgi:anti-sigma B factor antagonist
VEEFAVTSQTVAGTCLLVASGELDIATVPELEAPYDAALRPAPSAILVDLRAVTFIDSTGMALLLRMIERAGAIPVRFRVSAAIERLLEIIGLEGQIPLAEHEPPATA